MKCSTANRTTVRTFNPRTRHRVSEYERQALEEFNADLKRSYPDISDAPATRNDLVHRAAQANCSRFQLCRDAVRLTRSIHNSTTRRMATTINNSLAMLAGAQRKPVTSAAMAQAVAA